MTSAKKSRKGRGTGARSKVSALEKSCSCMAPPFRDDDFALRDLGEDPTNGRYGEVRVETCLKCGRRWLHYAVEYASFSRSGRWFRALVSDAVAAKATPRKAIAIIEASNLRFAGGSYYDSTGFRLIGEVHADL
jgi:hypothetical protein